MWRFLTALLGAFHALFGAFMLIDSETWLSLMIGRDIHGPLPGQHFIYDVGFAFLASGIGFAIAALRSNLRGAALVACLFPAFHAAMHAIMMMQAGSARWLFDCVVIVAPALIGVALAAQTMAPTSAGRVRTH